MAMLAHWAKLAVVSALFPCLVGCRLRVVSLPCFVGFDGMCRLRIALYASSLMLEQLGIQVDGKCLPQQVNA